MAVIHLNPFTGTDAVDVDTLTPTTGAAMTYISGVRMLIKDNRAYANGATARYEINEAPTYPYMVTASVHVVSKVVNELTTIQCRAATTSLNFFMNANAGTMLFSLGSLSESVTITAGNTYEMKILCHSATQSSCWLDGVMLFGGMITHASRGVATKVRMLNEDATTSSTTGVHFDTLEVENLAAPEPFKYRTIAQGLASRMAEDDYATLARRAIGGMQLGGFVVLESPLRPLLRFFGIEARIAADLDDNERRTGRRFRQYRPVTDIVGSPVPPYVPGTDTGRDVLRVKRHRMTPDRGGKR